MSPRTPPSLSQIAGVQVCLVVLLACVSPGIVDAQQEPDRLAPDSPSEVAVRIDGKAAISKREIDQMVKSIVDDQPISDGLRRKMRDLAIQQLIGQRLILSYLEQQELAASDTDIDVYVDQLQSRLEKQNVSWDEFLKRLGISQQEYRTSVRWKLSWENHLRTFLTDKNLQRFFEQHRRDYDGTEVSVAQILIKVSPDATQEQIKAARKKLGAIKQQIDSGELDFEAAAKEYSEAASAPDGGALGRLKRHGVMPEAFTEVAFGLQPGEISSPIATNVGVHLIQCQKEFPGSKRLGEVEAEVRRGATRFLFDWRVQQEREKHRIEILLDDQ